MQFFPSLAFIKRIPMIVWVFLGLGFLLVQASLIAPPAEVERFQIILVTYLVLMIAFLRLAPRVSGLYVPFNTAILWLVGGFVGTVFLMTAVQQVPGLAIPPYAAGAALYLLILTAIVPAAAEEVIFRGALPRLISPLLAAAAFSIFHAAAYQLAPVGMLVAFFAAIVFWVLTVRFSIYLAIGVHAGWNTAIVFGFATAVI